MRDDWKNDRTSNLESPSTGETPVSQVRVMPLNSDPSHARTTTPAETEAFAADFAKRLRGGECLALHGDLGAGKTRFVRGLVRGLNGEEHSVSSPTYVLLNVYDTARLTVYHLDAYRVSGAGDFEG